MNRFWSLAGLALLLGLMVGCQEKSRSYSERVLRDTLTVTETDTLYTPTPPANMVVKHVGESDDLQEEILRASLSGQPTALVLSQGFHSGESVGDRAPLIIYPGVSLYGTPGRTRIGRHVIMENLSQGETISGITFNGWDDPKILIDNCNYVSLQYCLSDGTLEVLDSVVSMDHLTMVNRATGLADRTAIVATTNSVVTLDRSVFEGWGIQLQALWNSTFYISNSLFPVSYANAPKPSQLNFTGGSVFGDPMWINKDWALYFPAQGSPAVLNSSGDYAGALAPIYPQNQPVVNQLVQLPSISQQADATLISFTQSIVDYGQHGWWLPLQYRFELRGAPGELDGVDIRLYRENSQVLGELVSENTLRETAPGSGVYYMEFYTINLVTNLEQTEVYWVLADLSQTSAQPGTPVEVELLHLNWWEQEKLYGGQLVAFDNFLGTVYRSTTLD